MARSTRRMDRLRTGPSPATRCEIAVEMTSTPGRTGSNGVGKTSPLPMTVAPITTMRPSTWSRERPSAEHGRGADRLDRSLRAVVADRQALPEIGRYRLFTEHDPLGLENRFRIQCDRRRLQRKRRLDAVAGSEDQGNEARCAGIISRYIDDADRRAFRKAIERQDEAVGGRHARKRSAAIDADGLPGFVEHRSASDHAAVAGQRVGQRHVFCFIAGVEKQNIERYRLRRELRDLVDNASKRAAAERIFAFLAHGFVVDGDDQHDREAVCGRRG